MRHPQKVGINWSLIVRDETGGGTREDTQVSRPDV